MFNISDNVVKGTSIANRHHIVKYKNGVFYANRVPIANAKPQLGKRAMVFPTPINNKYDTPVAKVVSTMVEIALPYWSLVHLYMKVKGEIINGKFYITLKLYNDEWIGINDIREQVKR